MYACICNAVTVETVIQAVDDGAFTLEEVGEATSAGTCCGGCEDHLAELIEARCGVCPLAGLKVA